MPDITPIFSIPFPEDTDPVTDGAQDMRDIAFTVENLLAAGHRYAGTRIFTSTGTLFAKADAFGDSSNVSARAIVMTLVGGGGGGGGAGVTAAGESAAGGGGSAGAVGIHVLDSAAIAALGTTVTITIGAGGAGGVGAAAGAAGGDTIFGSVADPGIPYAGGGGGGAAGAATNVAHIRAGGTQAIAEHCNVENMRGGGGFASLNFATTVAGGVGGQGGGNALAGATQSVNDLGGRTASFPGGGGGGARNPASRATARNGAPGRRGIVIMDIYI